MSQQDRPGDVGRGVGLAVLLHVAAQVLMYLILLPFVSDQHLGELNALLPVFGIGLSQLVYLGPLWLYLRSRGREAMGKGVAIVVAVTFLLNAGCYGLATLG